MHTYTDLLSLKNKMGCLNSYTYEYYTGYRRWQDDEMEWGQVKGKTAFFRKKFKQIRIKVLLVLQSG